MNTKNKFFSSNGMSLVELSFLLPVVFLFIFAGVEFSRTLRIKILAQNLSREFANTLVRECVGYTKDIDIQACIDRYQGTIVNVAETLSPGARVYGAIFKTGPLAICQTQAVANIDYPSKIKVGNSNCGVLDTVIANVSDLATALEAAGTICVAEIYIPYTAILGFIPGYFRYNPTSFYAANTI